jgi:hypothetical protein
MFSSVFRVEVFAAIAVTAFTGALIFRLLQ